MFLFLALKKRTRKIRICVSPRFRTLLRWRKCFFLHWQKCVFRLGFGHFYEDLRFFYRREATKHHYVSPTSSSTSSTQEHHLWLQVTTNVITSLPHPPPHRPTLSSSTQEHHLCLQVTTNVITPPPTPPPHTFQARSSSTQEHHLWLQVTTNVITSLPHPPPHRPTLSSSTQKHHLCLQVTTRHCPPPPLPHLPNTFITHTRTSFVVASSNKRHFHHSSIIIIISIITIIKKTQKRTVGFQAASLNMFTVYIFCVNRIAKFELLGQTLVRQHMFKHRCLNTLGSNRTWEKSFGCNPV